MAKNPWFEAEVVVELQTLVQEIIQNKGERRWILINKLKKLDELGISFWRGGTPTRIHDWAGGFLYWRLRRCPDQVHVFDQQEENLVLSAPPLDDQKPLDMDDFKASRSQSDPHGFSWIASWKMQLPAGTVSPFGLLNNEEKDILVYFDQDIVSEEIMTFHPNTNEKRSLLKPKTCSDF